MATKTYPWRVVGRDHNGPVDRILQAPSGRQAEIDAKAAGIQVKRVDPVHGVEATALASEAGADEATVNIDWTTLQKTIEYGVCRGVIRALLVIMLVQLLIVLAVWLLITAIRGAAS